MKKTIEIYTCDLCNEKIERKDLQEVHILSTEESYNSPMIVTDLIDMCYACQNEYNKDLVNKVFPLEKINGRIQFVQKRVKSGYSSFLGNPVAEISINPSSGELMFIIHRLLSELSKEQIHNLGSIIENINRDVQDKLKFWSHQCLKNR